MENSGKIKRFLWRILKYSLLILLVLSGTIVGSLQFSSVQTYLGHKLSAWLSKELNTTITVEKVDIAFVKNIELKNVYIQSLDKDTLLYGATIRCDISDFSLKERYLKLNKVVLENITARLLNYKNDKGLNVDFLVNYFSSADTTKSKHPFKIDYGKLELKNIDFVFKNLNDTAAAPEYGINYSDIHVKGLYGNVSGLKFENDSIFATIQHLKGKEQCGLSIDEFSGNVKVSSYEIKVDSLLIKTAKTYLHGSYSMKSPEGWDTYLDFINKIDIRSVLLDSSYAHTDDVSYFVPEIKNIGEGLSVRGRISGTVASLHGKNIQLKFKNNTSFRGNFAVEGIPDIRNTYLHFDIDELTTNCKELSQVPIPPYDTRHTLYIPASINKLGNIAYKGKIDGFFNDLVAYGALKTDLGTMNTDLGLSILTDTTKKLSYEGKIKTASFRLGEILGNKDIGTVALNIKVNGKGLDLDAFEGIIEGNVDAISYKGYTYRAIKLTGDFKKKLFNGYFESKDENANLDFYGSANFANQLIDLDFLANIHRIDFSKLNFFRQDTSSALSTVATIQIKGDNIDNLTGKVNFNNTVYKIKSKTYHLDKLDLMLDQNQAAKNIRLNSDILDFSANGVFNISNIPYSVSKYLESYFPTFTRQNKAAAKLPPDEFTFRVNVKNYKPIHDLYTPSFLPGKESFLEGRFDATKNILDINCQAPQIEIAHKQVKQLNINCYTADKGIYLSAAARKIVITDSVYLGNFEFNSKGFDNKSGFTMKWDNQRKQKNSGEIAGDMVFSTKDLEVHLNKFGIYVADSLWTMQGDDRFHIDSSGMFNFNQLIFANNSQRIKIQGLISRNPKDQLEIFLDNFKLSQLNPLLKPASIQLEGTLSGKGDVRDVYNNAIFSSALGFSKLKINNKSIGTGEVKSNYDQSTETVSLMGNFRKEYTSQVNFNNIDFSGYYYPFKKSNNINIDCSLQAIDLSIIQPFVDGIFTIGRGDVTGKINLSGTFAKPLMNGRLSMGTVKNFKVNYLNTFYAVNGDILIEPDRIAFEDVKMTDANGSVATVWGNIFHDNFQNMKIDFDLNAEKFLCLNTSLAQNSTYYGRAQVSGNVGIYGFLDNINIEINVKTEKGTQFNIPLSGPTEVGDKEFIHFIKADTLKNQAAERNDLAGLNMKFNLEATPDAEVQLIFDQKAGDVIKAKGQGDLNLNIDTKGKFEMFGLYTLSDGNYLFTLENFINKKFNIESGSTIKWSGDPYNADISLLANYKQRASLAPFFPNETLAATNTNNTGTGSTTPVTGTPTTTTATTTSGVDTKKRYTVDCQLFMKGKLLTPDISFGIALPTVNETTRQQILGYLNTEQELNRQVFSLLLLKSFVTPLSLSNQSGVSVGGAVGSNASEMLSNQVNNWLSQITHTVDLGLNYRPGNELSNEELDLALSKQLFNDRLSIDGNVGVNNNYLNKTNTMIGDINVDYKVREDGKLRVKAFNRTNDTYQTSTQGGQFTTGVGLFYGEEFDTIGELYKRYLNKIKGVYRVLESKEEDTEPSGSER